MLDRDLGFCVVEDCGGHVGRECMKTSEFQARKFLVSGAANLEYGEGPSSSVLGDLRRGGWGTIYCVWCVFRVASINVDIPIFLALRPQDSIRKNQILFQHKYNCRGIS